MGNDPDRADAQRVRGQRAFCSNRGKRGGCGRTFALFFADVLPRHSVTASLLARLLAGMLAGAALKSAAEVLRTRFCLETFYRLTGGMRERLGRVRTLLSQEQKPPPSGQSDPLLHSVEHLHAVFSAGTGALAAFQLHFQRPFLG